MIPIAPRSTGRLVELLADEGTSVVKNQVLARLEDNDLINNLNQLRAQESYAQAEFDRKANLVDRGFVSKQDFDKAKSDLEAAQAAVQKAEDQAGYMKLLAPRRWTRSAPRWRGRADRSCRANRILDVMLRSAAHLLRGR
jgi:multidrug efflux pump subunit AcrA (membrane-fusion protein)